ncbi:MAG: AMP-binding protein, partial [Gammaproteobacteria bacterium]|nr:AMP-binding protein [Gammaproteobacteria bacterium]
APVPPKVLARYAGLLSDNIQIYTPYGATECLPVTSIGSQEVLSETRKDTDSGKGICVGKPVSGIKLYIIPLSNEAIPSWDPASTLKPFVPGEIVVQGPQVTSRYYNRSTETSLAKIYDDEGNIFHRMGDTGYLDDKGRLWFCGRKAHCVIHNKQVYYSICCEGVFNVHHKVFRTALVGIKKKDETAPAICVELEEKYYGDNKPKLIDELMKIGAEFEHTKIIENFFFHPAFPVDIRHNAKIDRHKLADWAQRKVR